MPFLGLIGKYDKPKIINIITIVAITKPKINPSTVLLGLIFGANFVLPNKTPPTYANVSLKKTIIISNNEVIQLLIKVK